MKKNKKNVSSIKQSLNTLNNNFILQKLERVILFILIGNLHQFVDDCLIL